MRVKEDSPFKLQQCIPSRYTLSLLSVTGVRPAFKDLSSSCNPQDLEVSLIFVAHFASCYFSFILAFCYISPHEAKTLFICMRLGFHLIHVLQYCTWKFIDERVALSIKPSNTREAQKHWKATMLASRVNFAVQAASTASKSKRGGGNSRVLAHLLGRGQDLVGPPDPLTNLRPVYYAPRFTAPTPGSSTKKLHPYQLDEFGTSNSSQVTASTAASVKSETFLGKSTSSRSRVAAQRLESLRRRFEAEDLEWRLQRRRLDQISHEHWARSNLAFIAAKEEAENRARMSSISPTKGQYDPYIMEEFHRTWVETRAPSFEAYQREWISGILGQLRPACRAVYRDLRWQFELWRTGASQAMS